MFEQLLHIYNVKSLPEVIVSANNNGAQGGILQYTAGHTLNNVAAQVNVANNASATNYLVVSRTTMFTKLKEQRQNCVLLKLKQPDDGSLAFYATGNGKFQPKSYIEIVNNYFLKNSLCLFLFDVECS